MADGNHDIGADVARSAARRLAIGASQGASGALPAVSIVIPTFRRQQLLSSCLEWIARCHGAECAEIIVVDQTPVSEWLPVDDRIAKRFFSFERRHASVPNVAAARNRGGMIASAELLLFLDDDIELEPEFLIRLLALFERDALDVAGSILVESFAAETSAGCGIEPAAWLPGVNTALRRKRFLAVGGYDENLFRYNEDAEFCHRLRLNGLRIGRSAGLRAIHHKQPSGGTRHYVSLLDTARSVMLCDLYFARAVGGGFPAIVWRAMRTIRYEWKGFGRIKAGTVPGRILACGIMVPVACVAAYRTPQTLPTNDASA